MKRKQFSLVIVALVWGIAVSRLAAQEKTEGESEATTGNGAFSRGPVAALRVENMTDAELQQRLSEYEAGKRDARDGYIILNQLWINYQGQKKTGTEEGQHINKLREEVLGKHSEFYRLQDFQLSDRINYFTRVEQGKRRAREAAKNWVPPDNVPTRILINDRHAVGAFQYRLDFFDLPNEIQVKANGTAFVLEKEGRRVALSEIAPKKSLRFAHTVDTLPRFSDAIPARFLACTSLLHDFYHPMTQEEKKTATTLGHRSSLPWKNPKADREQLCAVLSNSGDVVFSFGMQHLPDKVFFPLDMSSDGKKAAVMVGERVQVQGDNGRNSEVGNARAILIWTDGEGMKTVPIKEKNLGEMEILKKYMTGGF
jgi:hypothetical protein